LLKQFVDKDEQITTKYLKFYQKSDKILLKKYMKIDKDEKFSDFEKKADLDSKDRLFKNLSKTFKVKGSEESITKHPFEMEEIVTQISEFLGPKNLWHSKVVFKSLPDLKAKTDSYKLKIIYKKKEKDLSDLVTDYINEALDSKVREKGAQEVLEAFSNYRYEGKKNVFKLASMIVNIKDTSLVKAVRDLFKIEKSSGLKEKVSALLKKDHGIDLDSQSYTNEFDLADQIKLIGNENLSSVVDEYFHIEQ
jgi:hypothetical protein